MNQINLHYIDIELFIDMIDDNLTIPLLSGLVMTLAQMRLNVTIPLP
jgi:hypothetical protein